VLVVRDPRDNIRSILNRVGARGDLDELDLGTLAPCNPTWGPVLDGTWLGIHGDNYIERLANRWNAIADLYFRYADNMQLIRFEDFITHKRASIAGLASELGLLQKRDITSAVDVQFQPRGNREISWSTFYGERNLLRIEELCGSLARRFAYPLNALERGSETSMSS
jgi:hypothetical protein